MFEFAISQHRKRPLSRRFLGSWVLSLVAHAAALGILIEFPELLRPGSHMWLRFPTLNVTPPPEPEWRTVAIVGSSGRLALPSAETLRRAMYNWSRSETAMQAPPIRVRWGDDRPTSSGNTTEPAPPVQPGLGTQEPKPIPDIASTSTAAQETARGESANDPSRAEFPVSLAAAGAADAKRPPVFLPAPERTEPRRIPQRIQQDPPEPPGAMTEPRAVDGTKVAEAAPPQSRPAPRLFADEQSAIRTEGSGLFDTKGFPLGEYAQIIIDRIKGNWLIPSNLRDSQGRSTLIFFIEKDGSVSNLRVVTSSGSQSLDLAALSAVLASKPLPPLPGGFPGEHVGAKFVFSYNEPQ